MSVNKMTAYVMSVEIMTVVETPVNKMTAYVMSVDKMTAYVMPVDKMSVCVMSVEIMTVVETPVNKMTAYVMSVDEMTSCQKKNFNTRDRMTAIIICVEKNGSSQNVSKQNDCVCDVCKNNYSS